MLFPLMFLATALIVYASIQNPTKIQSAAKVLGILFTLATLILVLQEAPAGTFKLVHDISNLGTLVACMIGGATAGLGLFRLTPNTPDDEGPGEFTDIGEGI